MGKPGCVRSNAWIGLFSSKLNTAALCGGSRYSPTTSRNFSSKRGSLPSLKVRIRCGLSPCARHTRWTKLWVVFRCRAIDRHDQWVASFGVVCVVASMTWLRLLVRVLAAVVHPTRAFLLNTPHPLFRNTASPAPDLVRIDPQIRGNRLVRHSLRCHQNNSRSLAKPHRGATRRSPLLQPLAL